MRQAFVFVTILLSFASQAFAATANVTALKSAWKNASAMHGQKDQNDITMVYGGTDISNRFTNIPKKSIA